MFERDSTPPDGSASPTPAETPRPERFGPYRVVRSIGVGGMGEVFEAVEEPLGRRVAVKTIRRRSTSPSLLLRFDRERRTLARLHHTNVVPIYATGTEGELPYFAMPYLAGASLGQVIKTARSHNGSGNGRAGSSFEELVHEAHSRSLTESLPPPAPEANGRDTTEPTVTGPSTPPVSSTPATTSPPDRLSRDYIRAAVLVMARVAEGLHHAHEGGVIHRDVKPSNIIVEEDSHVWVLDFGLAALKLEPADAPAGSLASAILSMATPLDATLTVGPLGTPLYMAPEQHADAHKSDARSDVWGLGATLYELLTLQRAFPTPAAALASEPIRPCQLAPALDRALEAIILKALSKDPADRYPTARALAEDLTHWLRNEPVSAWPIHRVARLARRACLWSSRNKGWAAALALAVFGSLGLGVYAEERRQQAMERVQAQERRFKLLEIQHIQQGEHRQNWSRGMWHRIAALNWTPEDRGAAQGLAVAALTGLDVSTEKEPPLYAQALAFAPDGRLWMSHTGEGPRRRNPETDRLDSWDMEVAGPLAIRPDGSPWQLGPSYPDPDRPDRSPLDPRPNPRFPLQVLDVERQAIARTIDDPVEGGSRLLTWTLAPQGSHAAAAVVDPQDQPWLLVWDAETGRLIHRIAMTKAPESPALPGVGLAFAPHAGLLASWDGSGRVDLWDVADGQPAASLTHRNPVHCVAYGPNLWRREEPRNSVDRWLLAVGDSDSTITLWEPGAKSARHVLWGSGLEVLTLAFSPDGTLLASAGRSIHALWDVATGRRLVGLGTLDYATALADPTTLTGQADGGYGRTGAKTAA